jgi:type IV pilus assembly protein PilP
MTRRLIRLIVVRLALGAALVVCAAPSRAQQPAAGSSRPAPLPGQTAAAPLPGQTPAGGASEPGKPQQQPPPPPDVFTYNPEGRRDPFVSLLLRGGDMKPTRESRPDGLPGLLISEISLRGILKDKTGFVAMVAGPDNKTHIIRGNDKVFDGTVKAITADSVIFSQDVNDPLSLVKQREVRKYLRATQEGK